MATRQMALAACFSALMLMSSAQAGDTWPTRSVVLIVPFGPGGAADGSARLFADKLSKRWGQAVVVDNRPGADAIIGTAAFVRTQDDHTLLYSAASTLTVTPLVQENLPFDAERDVKPISATCSAVFVLAVNNNTRAHSVAELVALAKAQPGKLFWSSAPGLPRYVFQAFLKQRNLDMTYVPYRDVAIPQADLGEGRLQVMITTQQAVTAPVQSRKATIIAVTNKARGPLLPEVPTMAEAGFPELTIDGLSGFFGAPGMSTAVRDKISADVQAVSREPEIRSRIEALGQQTIGNSAAEFTAALDEQRARAKEVAEVINLKAGQ
jgi:tripartite-type tricarboxylate transporter receptor subunit TctC